VFPAALAATAVCLAGCTVGPDTQPSRRSTAHSISSTSAPAPATSAPVAVRPRTVTIIASGDVLIHPPLWQQAHADARAAGHTGYDFGPMYASIAPDTRAADLAICEMETPLAPPQGPFTGWPTFTAPPQVLTALKGVGYDSCTTASNHTIDEGYQGVVRTLDELDAAGLKHTGSARTAAEAARPLIITTANGVKVAQLAYSFDFNGIAVPAGKPWLANRIDVPAILAAAHRAKKAGADIVVLSMHWGTEYDHLATSTQRSQAEQLLASPDIDVILGDHAHVVQPMQKLHGKWVVFCMGNQISRHADPIAAGREGLMPRFTFTEVSPGQFQVTRAEAIPTWMQDVPALRLIDIPRALADPATSAAERATLQQQWRAIRGYLDAYGAVAAGLHVVH
jgi:poly-gamma-glutamate synthesis protein (capsule biosynthesis protein)